MKKLILLLILATSAAATHEYYFYNNENDFRHNRAAALYNPFDGHDVKADFDDYECFSLDDYNYYANRDPYDDFDPLTARTISNSEFHDLRYEDQLRIINENPYDKWDRNDISDEGDMECWTLKDYNNFAATKPSDRYDEIRFHDFDDLERVNEIGIRRYGFIEPDDLAEFDLHLSRPSHYNSYYYEPYYYSFYR